MNPYPQFNDSDVVVWSGRLANQLFSDLAICANLTFSSDFLVNRGQQGMEISLARGITSEILVQFETNDSGFGQYNGYKVIGNSSAASGSNFATGTSNLPAGMVYAATGTTTKPSACDALICNVDELGLNGWRLLNSNESTGAGENTNILLGWAFGYTGTNNGVTIVFVHGGTGINQYSGGFGVDLDSLPSSTGAAWARNNGLSDMPPGAQPVLMTVRNATNTASYELVFDARGMLSFASISA